MNRLDILRYISNNKSIIIYKNYLNNYKNNEIRNIFDKILYYLKFNIINHNYIYKYSWKVINHKYPYIYQYYNKYI